MALDLEGIACSVGSACATGSTEVSHVLTAMGYPDEEARGALRLSLGRTTTDDEIDDGMRGRAAGRRARCGARLPTAVARGPAGQARAAREPDPRRDVGRGRLVGRGGARSTSGPRGRRRLDAPPRRRRHVLGVQEELLLARRGRRRAAGRGPARHPVLRDEPRARVRRRRAAAVPRRLPRRRGRRRPCVDCNTYVKFGALLGRARHLYDCEAVATGHYARRDGRAPTGARACCGPATRTRTRPTSCTGCARTSSSTPASRSAS